ncbi:4'-phosphopantetheinyl transferase superfamily protein [Variovorax sp. J31P207]|uniref:4'-phosphopantetheinyl transferase family protein n=1 Tax=Variovorax sp. J31P207 TaxID=3053510 RepID=UPI00257627BC|nr:4'-phosphopantetheinyl transferase superfamily protein [Variovorax sp. J31P207]MDM0068841.1 4'-phosphopantetheinyl transferase superfamily protein [Variovorax sp. J31P207]
MTLVQLPASSHCQLWRADLDSAPTPAAVACLSDDEWERARRFVFARDRHRFVAAHAALRSTLAQQTGIPGALLDFTLGAFGKPVLIEPTGLHFNLSHSQSVALIAISDGAEIGVDVELLRPMPDAAALAADYFTAAEQRALASLPSEQRDRAFLVGWTRKEACLKAVGTGLGIDTRSFEAGLEEDAREVRLPLDGRMARLALHSFDGGEGVVCAIARVLESDAAALAVAPHPVLQDNETYA